MMTLASLFTNARTALRPLLALGFTLWLLGWGAAAYGEAGRGPLGGHYDPTPITAHARLLPRFLAQLPTDAAVTATAAVHPHVSHRRYVYQFPIGVAELGEAGQAEWALLDVTTNTDMAPGDLKSAVDQLLAGAWGVVDGADSFLLLQRGATTKEIPHAFYDFARGTPNTTTRPTTAPLVFTGVTVEDWPRWRQTRLRACWQVGSAFQGQPVTPQFEVITPAGDVSYSFAAATPPALLWYPPARWQAGETVCQTTLPLYLPRRWGVRVAPDGATSHDTAAYTSSLLRSPAGLALVQRFERTRTGAIAPIAALPEDQERLDNSDAASAGQGSFLVGDKVLQTTLWSPAALVPGEPLDLHITWHSEQLTDWPANLSVFVHVRQGEQTIAQADGPPRFFLPRSVAANKQEELWVDEWRQITLPAIVTPGASLTIALGVYDPATGERMTLHQATGQSSENELRLTALPVKPVPPPDQACALQPAACASQPVP